jgi:hypothetical protein
MFPVLTQHIGSNDVDKESVGSKASGQVPHSLSNDHFNHSRSTSLCFSIKHTIRKFMRWGTAFEPFSTFVASLSSSWSFLLRFTRRKILTLNVILCSDHLGVLKMLPVATCAMSMSQHWGREISKHRYKVTWDVTTSTKARALRLIPVRYEAVVCTFSLWRKHRCLIYLRFHALPPFYRRRHQVLILRKRFLQQ